MNVAADEPFCYLTTTGRRSGRPHRIEIWFGASGSTLYLLAGGGDRSDWVRNLRADPRATVEVDGVVHRATGREVDDPEEDRLARALLLEKYQRDDELEDWGRRALAVALDLGR